MTQRKPIPPSIETQVLQKSCRRCCLCWGLQGDTAVKQGQIAHLDHDPSNCAFDNLVFLCLEHHAQYDAKSPQSKGFSQDEVRSYRDRLYAADVPEKQDAPLIVKNAKFDAVVKNADQAFSMLINRPAVLSDVEASLRAENVKMGAAFSTDQCLSSILGTCAACGNLIAAVCTGRPSSISVRCKRCGKESVIHPQFPGMTAQ
jgi:hypothetical protein